MRSARPAVGLVSHLGEPLLSADEVAAYFSVSPTTIYRLAAQGELPAIEIAPRVLRFKVQDVREFLERRTRHARASGRVKRLLRPRS